MKCVRAWGISVASLLASLVYSGSAVASGGHFFVDDAALMRAGSCQLETWVTRTRPEETLYFTPMCNVTGGFELSLPFVYSLSGDDLTHVGMEYKTVFYDRGRGPAFAFSAGGLFDLNEDDVSDVYINLPMSVQLVDQVVFHANIGLRHDNLRSDTYTTWGLASSVRLPAGPQLIAEVGGDREHDPLIGFGVRFGLGGSRWTLDLGIRRDTGTDRNSYTIGLNSPAVF